ncbi:hypothetical protein EMIT0P258_200057 [Pseudomonas sp. IT-P258]
MLLGFWGNDEARDNNRTSGQEPSPFSFDERASYSYRQKSPEGLGSKILRDGFIHPYQPPPHLFFRRRILSSNKLWIFA